MSSVSSRMILELGGVCYSYGKGGPFIRNLSFSVGEGEFIGLLGANGSGKSTIMKLASGLLRPSSGDVRLWGKDLAGTRHRDRAKLISYLPQTLDISVPFTVAELVAMGLYPYDIPPAMSVADALEMTGLTGKADAHLSDLSGGERRRTFIAMTLLQGAGLLMLDEPLANLDIKYQIELVKLLKKLRAGRNISVVMLIKEGNLIGAGRPEEVLSKAMVKQAFDVDVEIRTTADNGVYISYEDHFQEDR